MSGDDDMFGRKKSPRQAQIRRESYHHQIQTEKVKLEKMNRVLPELGKCLNSGYLDAAIDSASNGGFSSRVTGPLEKAKGAQSRSEAANCIARAGVAHREEIRKVKDRIRERMDWIETEN